MFESREVRAKEFNHSARSGGIKGILFLIFFNMNVCCVFSVESPHQGDINKHTQYTVFMIKNKITLGYRKSEAMGFFLRAKEGVRNSRGKRAISVRAIEVLLYFFLFVRNRVDIVTLVCEDACTRYGRNQLLQLCTARRLCGPCIAAIVGD